MIACGQQSVTLVPADRCAVAQPRQQEPALLLLLLLAALLTLTLCEGCGEGPLDGQAVGQGEGLLRGLGSLLMQDALPPLLLASPLLMVLARLNLV